MLPVALSLGDQVERDIQIEYIVVLVGMFLYDNELIVCNRTIRSHRLRGGETLLF